MYGVRKIRHFNYIYEDIHSLRACLIFYENGLDLAVTETRM